MTTIRPFSFLCGLSATALTAPAAVRAVTRASRDLVFTHGVVSGDPQPDRVVPWTRIAPVRARVHPVPWESRRARTLPPVHGYFAGASRPPSVATTVCSSSRLR